MCTHIAITKKKKKYIAMKETENLRLWHLLFIEDSTGRGLRFSPWPISSYLFSLTWKGSFLYLLSKDKVGLSYSVKLRMKKIMHKISSRAPEISLTFTDATREAGTLPWTSNASLWALKDARALKDWLSAELIQQHAMEIHCRLTW